MGRIRVKNIEIVAMSEKEYEKHLNDIYKKVKKRDAKKQPKHTLKEKRKAKKEKGHSYE